MRKLYKMSLRELKFSNQIQEEQIKSVYHKNFNYIVTERFYFQQQKEKKVQLHTEIFGMFLFQRIAKPTRSKSLFR